MMIDADTSAIAGGISHDERGRASDAPAPAPFAAALRLAGFEHLA